MQRAAPEDGRQLPPRPSHRSSRRCLRWSWRPGWRPPFLRNKQGGTEGLSRLARPLPAPSTPTTQGQVRALPPQLLRGSEAPVRPVMLGPSTRAPEADGSDDLFPPAHSSRQGRCLFYMGDGGKPRPLSLASEPLRQALHPPESNKPERAPSPPQLLTLPRKA